MNIIFVFTAEVLLLLRFMANVPARVLLWCFVCVVCLFVVWFVVVVFPVFYGMIIQCFQIF